MKRFTEKLIVEPLDDGEWRLVESFSFITFIEPRTRKKGGMKFLIKVEAGETTDFASIPRFLWVIMPPYSPDYGKAAVIHDSIYKKALFNKAWADKVFLEALGVLGCGKIKKYIMFIFVKLFGKGKY